MKSGKPHMTREVGMNALQHLIENVLEQPDSSPIYKALKEEGITSVIDLLTTTSAEVESMSYFIKGEDVSKDVVMPLSKKDKRELKMLLMWVKYIHRKQSNIDWETLTPDDLIDFREHIAPTLIEGGGKAAKSEAEKFKSNVKMDIKQYPTFNGEIEGWLKFKRNVLSIAATHDLEDILQSD